MNPNSIVLIEEPELEFRYGQRLCDPHSGLALFGPYDVDASSHPRNVSFGVVGTDEGLPLFERFAATVADPVVSQGYGNPEEDRKAHLLWPPFPGFEAAFHSRWVSTPAWSRTVDGQALLEANEQTDSYRRAFAVASFFLEAIRTASLRDENLGLIVCVVPDKIWQNCRPKSVVQGVGPAAADRAALRRVQPNFLNQYDPKEYEFSVDFRRQLKARAMEFKVPIQIVLESTLETRTPTSDEKPSGLTVLSDRAWNLLTTAYYKAGGKPWRLSTARNGVCYVGIAFKKTDPSWESRTACCAAQMFLDSGDGVVFRSEFGPWYSPLTKQCHLEPDEATNLLKGVLKAYREQEGPEDLREIFLHSRSTISKIEFDGYKKACPSEVKLVGIRVRQDRDGLRLYRQGKWPIVRGTAWILNGRSAYLWASGFKPAVLSYDGWEVPVPLRIDIEHGEADIHQVAKDILGLTKLNYNACKLGDAAPVTIGFSDTVGEILVSNPTLKNPRPNFKFYI